MREPAEAAPEAEYSKAVIVGVPFDDPRLSKPVTMELGAKGKLKRNTFACTNCHAQKSKCVPSDFQDIYRKPCMRCAHSKRVCQFDLSKRTRKRRRDGGLSSPDVAHSPGLLDGSKSVSALTPLAPLVPLGPLASAGPLASLSAGSQASTWSSVSAEPVRSVETANSATSGQPAHSRTSSTPALGGMLSRPTHSTKSGSRKHALHHELQMLLSWQREKLESVSSELTRLSEKWNDAIENTVAMPLTLDPISLGIITREQAEFRLQLYRSEISNNYRLPFVKIAANKTLDEIRKEEPLLFTSVMSIVSGMLTVDQASEDQNMKLDNFTLCLISHRMMRMGDKSVELLKSLLTLCLWYNFPEWSNKTRYHFFNYVCCCLVRDLVPVSRPKLFSMMNNHTMRSEDESTSIDDFLLKNESYPRLIILVYVSALNINIFLRQSIQNRWGIVQERACNILSSSSVNEQDLREREEASVLIMFGKLNHILEKVHIKLHEADEEDTYEEGLFSQTQKKIVEQLQKELEEFFQEIPYERLRVMAFFYSVQAYLHEWIFSRFIAKFADQSTIQHVPVDVSNSFLKCCESCISAMREFLKLSPELIASLPLFHISRIIYTVGMLLLRLRYTTVTIPAFSFLKPSTEQALTLVKDISTLLDRSAELYPYNNFLTKLRYVVTLFVQIYANKVKAFIENSRSHIETRANQVNEPLENSMSAPDQRSLPMLLNPVSPSNDVPDVPLASYREDLSNDLNTSSGTSEDFNSYLADINSLEIGFNALNDEFWTDVFMNNM